MPDTVTSIKFISVLSVCILIYALFYRENDSVRVEKITLNLLNIEAQNKVKHGDSPPRVAIGYGPTQDNILHATKFLDHTKLEGEPEHFSEIKNEKELLKSFAYFFKHGAAAERFVNSELLFSVMVKALEFPGRRFTIGGNTLMAKTFFSENWKVFLASKKHELLAVFIPRGIVLVGDEDHNVLIKYYINVVLEFKAGDMFGDLKAPRANRYIIHGYRYREMLKSFEAFNNSLPEIQPDLLIVTGLQLLDEPIGLDQDMLTQSLGNIKKQLVSQPEETLTHFQMGSFVYQLALIKSIILPYVDSIGADEQELAHLHSLLVNDEDVSYVANSNPEVAEVLDKMRTIFKMIRQNNEEHDKGKLSRFHTHTLAYQAILTVKKSKWIKTAAATVKASLTAHRVGCNTEKVNASLSKILLGDSFSITANSYISRTHRTVILDPEESVACWEEALDGVLVEICVAPVPICIDVNTQRSAGLVDAVSAAALSVQVTPSNNRV